MSDIEEAAKDAVEAAANSQQLALIAAVLQAQQLTQQPPAPVPAATPSSGSTVKWLVIGGVAVIGGPFLFMSFAAAAMAAAATAVALAISGVALTICLLILRSVWRSVRKDK